MGNSAIHHTENRPSRSLRVVPGWWTQTQQKRSKGVVPSSTFQTSRCGGRPWSKPRSHSPTRHQRLFCKYLLRRGHDGGQRRREARGTSGTEQRGEMSVYISCAMVDPRLDVVSAEQREFCFGDSRRITVASLLSGRNNDEYIYRTT
jgi:hypothetical protein